MQGHPGRRQMPGGLSGASASPWLAAAPPDPRNEEVRHYSFGPLESRGLIAGWRGGQIAVIGAGALCAVAILRYGFSFAALAGAVLSLVAGATVATLPINGFTIEQWIPLIARWGVIKATTKGRWISPLPGLGSAGAALACLKGKGVFEGMEIMGTEVAGSDLPAGVIWDVTARTCTTILAVRADSFLLQDPAEQDRRASAWGGILASLSRERSNVYRLQWVARSLPDPARECWAHLVDHGVKNAPPGSRRSYEALLEEVACELQRHEILLAVSVRARSRSSLAKSAAASLAVLETRSIAPHLGEIGVGVIGVLSPAAVASCIRRSYELPTGAHLSSESGYPARRYAPGWRSSASAAQPWPLAVAASWGELHTDSTWHASYWISEWPRIHVAADFLGSLLVASRLRHAVSVVMEPMSLSDATRQVESDRIADIADRELRRRAGFLLSARRRKEEESVVKREAELADGHAHYRFSGYLTVSAASKDDLDEATQRAEQVASQAHIELRRLYGDQERAFACTLPLGRGLR